MDQHLMMSEIDFMKSIPMVWDETIYLDGYPGKYYVLARRSGDNWFVVGINAENETLDLNLSLPMLVGATVSYIGNDSSGDPFKNKQKIDKSGRVKVSLPPNDGMILTNMDF